MNAQNWQTIPRIGVPLRKLGIPTVAIFDIDVVMDKDFKKIWPLVNAEPAVLTVLQTECAVVKALFVAKGSAVLKDKGVSAFSGPDRQRIDSFIQSLAEHGVLLVVTGELECWLKNLQPARSKGDKAKWLLGTFAAMGPDPQASNYLQPSNDDVWEFMTKAKVWIDDPARRGIPS